MKRLFALLHICLYVALAPIISLSFVSCENDNIEDNNIEIPDIIPEFSVPDSCKNYFVEDLLFGHSAAEAEVTFLTNTDWTLQVTTPDGDSTCWCSVSPTSGKAGLQKVIIRVSDNDTYESRCTKINLNSGISEVAEISVVQNYINAVLLSSNCYNISYQDTFIEVELRANVNFDYSIADTSWIHEQNLRARSLATHHLVFEIDENKSQESRESHILFYNSEYAVADTLTLIQEGNPNGILAEAVDLGLSVKWASCNIGAKNVYEVGYYLAWGETEEKDEYSLSTYFDKSYKIFNTLSKKCLSGTGYDAATVLWGEEWMMPTYEQATELYAHCTWEWTDNYEGSNVAGCICTGPNGNHIFFPAGGLMMNTSLQYTDCGNFWTGSLYRYNNVDWANFIDINRTGTALNYVSRDHRYWGRNVRPVRK